MKKYEESKYWDKGKKKADFYEEELTAAKEWKRIHKELPSIFRPEDMPWENSKQGKIKHVVHEKMNPVNKTIDAYIQEIPVRGKSGKHRHMAEEVIFILEGKGYDLHWDVDFELANDHFEYKIAKEPKRFEWKKGDLVVIPVNTVHQHFNSNSNAPARFLSARSTIYKHLNFGDLEQIEDATDSD